MPRCAPDPQAPSERETTPQCERKHARMRLRRCRCACVRALSCAWLQVTMRTVSSRCCCTFAPRIMWLSTAFGGAALRAVAGAAPVARRSVAPPSHTRLASQAASRRWRGRGWRGRGWRGTALTSQAASRRWRGRGWRGLGQRGREWCGRRWRRWRDRLPIDEQVARPRGDGVLANKTRKAPPTKNNAQTMSRTTVCKARRHIVLHGCMRIPRVGSRGPIRT